MAGGLHALQVRGFSLLLRLCGCCMCTRPLMSPGMTTYPACCASSLVCLAPPACFYGPFSATWEVTHLSQTTRTVSLVVQRFRTGLAPKSCMDDRSGVFNQYTNFHRFAESGIPTPVCRKLKTLENCVYLLQRMYHDVRRPPAAERGRAARLLHHLLGLMAAWQHSLGPRVSKGCVKGVLTQSLCGCGGVGGGGAE
jgi:hypothetical protein